MKHHRNYVQPKGEVNTLPSKTIPGQTLPIRTLVDRYRKGMDVPTFEGSYNDDPEFDGLERLDKVERAQLALEVRQSVKSQQAHLQRIAEDEIKKATSKDDAEAITPLDV